MARSAKAGAMLTQAYNKATHELWDEYKDTIERNNEAILRSGWGGLLGAVGAPLLTMGAFALAGPAGLGLLASGNMPLWAGTAAAGLGSWGGREIGEQYEGILESGPIRHVGEIMEEGDLTSPGFAQKYQRELEENITDAYGSFDQEQVMSSLADAGTAFLAGGGMKTLSKSFNPAFNVPFSERLAHAFYGGPGGYQFNPFMLLPSDWMVRADRADDYTGYRKPEQEEIGR